jgi:hypothetical protein
MISITPGQRAPEDRVDQYCDSCKAYDKHPRHIHGNNDGSVTSKHMDCCLADGCPDRSCADILGASRRAHGEGLIAFLAARQARPGD